MHIPIINETIIRLESQVRIYNLSQFPFVYKHKYYGKKRSSNANRFFHEQVVVVVLSMLTSFYFEYDYLDVRSQIKVHTDERTPAHGASVPWWSPIHVLNGVDVA